MKSLYKCALFAFAVLLSNSANASVIADSVADFSGTQGYKNWYYGYFKGPFTSSAFTEMTHFYPQYDWPMWLRSEGEYWTALWDRGGHPNGAITSTGRRPEENWTVRRWVSPVDGMISISGILAQAGWGSGVPTSPVGTDLDYGHTYDQILVDGIKVFSSSSFLNGNYTVSALVHVGSTVDFAIAPSPRDFRDQTTFTARISATDVPEPAALALFSAGLGGLL
ncbi:MAG: hypothetical protein F8N15_10295, partial [Methanobacterium sp.]|nr:hypothetical protein [Methanobacterium sp.]